VRGAVLLVVFATIALASASQVGSTTAVRARAENHACYPAQFNAFRPRKITIVDSVARMTAIVRRPLEVCAPASVDTTAPSNSNAYLSCYEVTVRPTFGRRRLGTISNLLGRWRLSVAPPRTVCVSSSQTSPGERTRLACYTVAAPTTETRRDTAIGDAFGTSRDSVFTSRPERFCTGTKGRTGTPLHVACYSIESKTLARTVVLTDEWGTMRASPGLRNRLCLQSTLTR
jgi:hypothetical protein